MVFSVATNLLAFVPLLYVPGELGVMYRPMVLLIFAVFIVSLVEALLILPAHLRAIKKSKSSNNPGNKALEAVKQKYFKPSLRFAIAHPFKNITLFIALLAFIAAWFYSGRLDMSFVPKVESTRIDAEFEFPLAMPLARKQEIISIIEQRGLEAFNVLNGEDKFLYSMSGTEGSSGHVTFRLVADTQRDFSAYQFVEQWRSAIGHIAGLRSLFFDYQVGPGGGKELEVELSHSDSARLAAASEVVVEELRRLRGLSDVTSNISQKSKKYNLRLNDFGRHVGFDADSLGQLLAGLFEGEEVVRQIIAEDEVKTRLRLAASELINVNDLSAYRLYAPNGQLISLDSVVDIEEEYSVDAISRLCRFVVA